MQQTEGVCDIVDNAQKNTYVKSRIEDATIKLLVDHELDGLSVSLIAAEAQVSRNAFYRNYATKEDIVLSRVRRMYSDWEESAGNGGGSNANLFGGLFGHLSDNRDFYLLLESRGLFHLLLQVMMEKNGPKRGYENLPAYVSAFVVHGTFGWIQEWMKRGMEESAQEMSALLSSQGIA